MESFGDTDAIDVEMQAYRNDAVNGLSRGECLTRKELNEKSREGRSGDGSRAQSLHQRSFHLGLLSQGTDRDPSLECK